MSHERDCTDAALGAQPSRHHRRLDVRHQVLEHDRLDTTVRACDDARRLRGATIWTRHEPIDVRLYFAQAECGAPHLFLAVGGHGSLRIGFPAACEFLATAGESMTNDQHAHRFAPQVALAQLSEARDTKRPSPIVRLDDGARIARGARGGIRTHDLRLRRPTLYPAELLAQKAKKERAAPFVMVGASGFEPPTSWSRTRRANRAAPRPAEVSRDFTDHLALFVRARRDSNSQPSDP